MNVNTTKSKGIKYCREHKSKNRLCFSDCPLMYNGTCINGEGEIIITTPDHDEIRLDFEQFAKDFNSMIKEIYKEDPVG